MARPRREQSDPRVIQDWINEGRGKGRNGTYQSWLRIQDVSSNGQCQRIPSPVTGDRQVHVLSGLETSTFFIYEWCHPLVTDIREQYPLPLEETMEIARELGVEHPAHRASGRPIVMTTDFLVSIKADGGEKHFARSVMMVKDLGSPREWQKLEIARRYHTGHGDGWGILTERDIPAGLAFNLQTLRERLDISRYGNLTEDTVARVSDVLLPLIWRQDVSLSDAGAHCDKLLGLGGGTSLTVTYRQLYARKWRADLMLRLDPGQPLILSDPQPQGKNEVLVQLPAAVA